MTAVKDFRVHQSGIRFASSCRRAAMFLEKPAGTLRSQETSPPLNRRHAVGKMLGPGRTGPDQAGLPVPSWPRSPSISIRCATLTMRCSVHGCDMLRVRQDCVRPASGPSAGGASSVRRCPLGRCGTCRRRRAGCGGVRVPLRGGALRAPAVPRRLRYLLPATHVLGPCAETGAAEARAAQARAGRRR